MTTTYKPITGYEGKYLVGDDGSIVSLKTKGPKVRHFSKDKIGYCRIVLSYQGRNETRYVHRLVAEAFVEGDSSLTVNHKDLNKANNRADNLEWITHAQNLAHARALRPWRPSEGSLERRRRAVRVIFPDGTSREFNSLNYAALFNGADAGNVCAAIKTGRLAYGKRWEYVEPMAG